jgi:endonuclease/exonuclease/phosphatase family metal-dependent hydrolase
MASILELPPPHIQHELKELKEDLNKKIPAKKLDRNLLIASWNIRAFGNLTRKWETTEDDSPRRDLHAVACIAEILSRFDVVAIQEVKANIRALRDTLKLLGENWGLILTDVTRGSAGNGERMAYIFDTRRVQLSGLAAELVVPKEWLGKIDGDAFQEQFVRTPYAVGFRSVNKTFILVTLHVKYGKKASERVDELKSIAKWIADWAKDVNAYHQNLIALGDFNIDARGDLLDKTFLSHGLHVPEALQNEKVTRSIFDETKYYDQIAWFEGSDNRPKLSSDFLRGGNYDFVGQVMKNRDITKQQLSWLISDHYPLWAEFGL